MIRQDRLWLGIFDVQDSHNLFFVANSQQLPSRCKCQTLNSGLKTC